MMDRNEHIRALWRARLDGRARRDQIAMALDVVGAAFAAVCACWCWQSAWDALEGRQ